jgi:hypothetical protein
MEVISSSVPSMATVESTETPSLHELRRSRLKPSLPKTLDVPMLTIVKEDLDSMEISFPPIEGADRYKIEYYQCGLLYNGAWLVAYDKQPLTSAGAMVAVASNNASLIKLYEETIPRPQCVVTKLVPGNKYCFRYSGVQFGSDAPTIVTSPETPPIQVCKDLVELGLRQLETEQQKTKNYANELQRTLRSLDQQITENKRLTMVVESLTKECQLRDSKMKVTTDLFKEQSKQLAELIEENKRTKQQLFDMTVPVSGVTHPTRTAVCVDVATTTETTEHVEDLTILVREYEAQISQLREDVKRFGTENELLTKQNQLLIKQNQLLVSENKNNTDKLDDSNAKLIDVAMDFAKVKQDLSLTIGELVTTKTKLTEAETDLTKVQTELAKTHEELATANAKVVELLHELESKASSATAAGPSTLIARLRTATSSFGPSSETLDQVSQYLRTNKTSLSGMFFVSPKMLVELSSIMKMITREEKSYRQFTEILTEIVMIMQTYANQMNEVSKMIDESE